MSLIKWDPRKELEEMFERYQRAIGLPQTAGHDSVATGDWSPRVDVAETDDQYTITAELPEIKKEDVKVTVEDRILTIQGERKRETEVKKKKFHRIERRYGSFVRSFVLPDTVDATSVKASLKNGLLSLSLPKTAASKKTAVEIKLD